MARSRLSALKFIAFLGCASPPLFAGEPEELALLAFEKACLVDPYDFASRPLHAPLLKGKSIAAEALKDFLPDTAFYGGAWSYGPEGNEFYISTWVAPQGTNIVGACAATFLEPLNLEVLASHFVEHFQSDRTTRDETVGKAWIVEKSASRQDREYQLMMLHVGGPEGVTLFRSDRLVGFLAE